MNKRASNIALQMDAAKRRATEGCRSAKELGIMTMRLAITYAIALALLIVAFLSFRAAMPFGKSFDPVIAFTIREAQMSDNTNVTVSTEQARNLYLYAVGLREKLWNCHLIMASVMCICGVALLAVTIQNSRMQK